MKLDTNLFAAKPPSLEEGPTRSQQPETIVANRVEIRSHYQRCVQVLKVILYLELILFVGWLGCISMSKYYQEPEYNEPGLSFANADRKNDISDDQQQKEPMVHMEPLVQEPAPRQETLLKEPLQEPRQETLQESSGPSTETVSSEMHAPVEAYFVWMTEDDALPTSTELSHSKATAEPIVDAGKDTNTPTKSTSDETDAPDLDTYLTKWLEDMADTKTNNDDLYGTLNLDKLFNDEDAGIVSGLLVPEIKTDDTLELDEPFKSFEERWKKIMDSIDEDLDALGPKLESSDEFRQVPMFIRIPHFGELDPISKEDSSMVLDPLFEMPFLRELLLSPSDLDVLRDSDESDSSSDLVNLANLHFGFEDPLLNEKNFWRNVRDTGAKDDSDSKSSSEETTTPAPKTKRSPNSSSGESDESSDSTSSEDIVGKIMTKTLSPTCPKIVGDDGKPIESPKEVIAHIKRSWHKSLLETPVPNCGDDDPPKIITIDECGKFVIECKPSGVKNETVEELLNTRPQVR